MQVNKIKIYTLRYLLYIKSLDYIQASGEREFSGKFVYEISNIYFLRNQPNFSSVIEL